MTSYITLNPFQLFDKGSLWPVARHEEELGGFGSARCTIERSGSDLVITGNAGTCIIFKEFFGVHVKPPPKSIRRASSPAERKILAQESRVGMPAPLASPGGAESRPRLQIAEAEKLYNSGPLAPRDVAGHTQTRPTAKPRNGPNMDMIMKGLGLRSSRLCT